VSSQHLQQFREVSAQQAEGGLAVDCHEQLHSLGMRITLLTMISLLLLVVVARDSVM
jgi:hypothetical protein